MSEIYWVIPKISGQRHLHSSGPTWPIQAFYDPEYVSPDYGVLDTSRMNLYFDPKEKNLPKSDFVGSVLLTCKVEVFEIFAPLIEGQVLKFSLSIEGGSYVVFRPTSFFDLVDIARCRYLSLPNGKPYNFTKVKLASAPPAGTEIFGLSSYPTTRHLTLVSESFKTIYDNSGFTGLQFRNAFP